MIVCLMLIFMLGCSGLTPQQQRKLTGSAMGAGAAIGAVGGAVVHELKKK